MLWITWISILESLVLIVIEGVSIIENVNWDEDASNWGRERRQVDSKSFKPNQANHLIPANYSPIEPPPTTNGEPSRVNISIIVMNIRGVDEKEEQMTLEINLRMFWRDSRLHLGSATGNHSFLVLSPKIIHDLWHPDLFIDHAISVSIPLLVTPPASLRIYPNSVIRYSARLTVTIACEMNFRLYPTDEQRCPVKIMSYAYPIKIMVLEWAESGAFFAHSVNLPNFKVDLEQTNRETTHTTSAEYSNLQFTMILRREIAYHLIQTYLPSFVFVLVSWIIMLIPRKNVTERISCCMVALLSLTVMFGSLGQSAPKVSYMTALHIWMLLMIIFVFIAFVEFVAVLKLWSLAAAEEAAANVKLNLIRKRRKRDSKTSINYAFEMAEIPCQRHDSSASNIPSTPSQEGKYGQIAATLEKVTAIALPGLFLAFNFIYWPCLFLAVSTTTTTTTT